jgi:MinD superfamily P-loop ATPase
MKQLLILSGKGGTGKTTVAGALIKLSQARAYADCDVDAPNLHLVMHHFEEPRRSDYFGLPKAVINTDRCKGCGLCIQSCRFEAISAKPAYRVDPFSCEGCGVCEAICPACAVRMVPAAAGTLMLYTGGDQVFSTAELKMGSGTSGKLVTEVKKQLKDVAADADLAVIDGSPGIGCPVIASISGVHMVLIVAEPSVSGISDMERIIKTAKTFHTKIIVCVNKYDINLENTDKIENFCRDNELPFAGKIPFDPKAVKAVNDGQTIVDIDCAAGRAVSEVYDTIREVLCE